MSFADVASTIKNGKGRMPGFANLENDSDQWYGLLSYVMSGGAKGSGSEPERAGKELPSSGQPSVKTKYHFTGYKKFLDPEGYPAVAPPWGTLNAINLNSGEYVWKIPLGEYPELAAAGMRNTGSENYGGPIVTAGGVLFIGATVFDRKMRAFDSHTGKLLWETTLPYAGVATPATYMIDGKQYVVIATGGGRDPKSPSGGEYVAFSLP
jgi:quinoprotein glucose dehydrogenase